MKTQTLFTAFACAQTRTPGTQPVAATFDALPAHDSLLVSALRHSATDRDQIIQRRIGMFTGAASRM